MIQYPTVSLPFPFAHEKVRPVCARHPLHRGCVPLLCPVQRRKTPYRQHNYRYQPLDRGRQGLPCRAQRHLDMPASRPHTRAVVYGNRAAHRGVIQLAAKAALNPNACRSC